MAQECALFYNDGGEAQGQFTGENFAGGDRADSSVIIEVQHSITSPTDAHTGRATGKRVHEPLRLLKQSDSATVHLLKALVTNENLKKLDLKWYRPRGDATEQLYYTITLENARVVKFDAWLPNTKDDELAGLTSLEWVSFVYETIIWKWEEGNKEADDSWIQPAT